MGSGKIKELYANMSVSSVPYRVLSQLPLAPNVTTVTFDDNDKGDNEVKQEAVHRSPDIYLADKKKTSETSVRTSLKAVRTVIASNVVYYLQKT